MQAKGREAAPVVKAVLTPRFAQVAECHKAPVFKVNTELEWMKKSAVDP